VTLNDALRALHEQGRIRSPWLPGMLLVADGPIREIRIRLHEEAIASFERAPSARHMGWDRAQHALTDPATVGCLLALLREASARPGAPPTRWALADWGDHWLCEPNSGPYGITHPGRTAGEAIAEALTALAGGS